MMSEARPGRRFDLRSVDLNLLVSLHHLLQESQVTAAAERMYVSQPSMSASLGRLRRLLDDPLLVRAGRRLVLTPYAEGLRDEIADILAQIENALSTRPSFDPETAPSNFVISATDYITLMVLKQITTELAATTQVHIEVRPVTTTNVDDLRDNKVDMIITPREVLRDAQDLHSATLFRDRFVGVASRDNSAVHGLTTETFSELPYLAYRSHGTRSNVDEQLDRLGIARNVQMTSESFVVAPLMVSGTNFIAIVQERLARKLMEPLNLQIFEPPVTLLPITQAVFWHPRRVDDPAHRWLRELIVQMARGLPD